LFSPFTAFCFEILEKSPRKTGDWFAAYGFEFFSHNCLPFIFGYAFPISGMRYGVHVRTGFFNHLRFSLLYCQ